MRPRANRPAGRAAAAHRSSVNQEQVKIDFSGYTAETCTTQSSKIEASVSQVDGTLAVRVHDDGIGGVPADGLTALRDRVAAVGGRLDFTSLRGAGTEIRR